MKFPLVVIPAGGRAERMGSLCKTTPKFRLEIRGKPIIDIITEYWSRYCVRAVVVCRPGQKTFDSEWGGNMRIDYIERNCSCVNAAILEGLKFAGCPERFMVVLGDCLVEGEYEFPWEGAHGIGVEEGDTDFHRSYAVGLGLVSPVIEAQKTTNVIEKPWQGQGVYLFRWSVIPELERYDGITEAVGALARKEAVVPMLLRGRYLNVTFPEDVNRW